MKRRLIRFVVVASTVMAFHITMAQEDRGQIDIQLQFLECMKTDIDALLAGKKGGRIDVEDLMALRKKGKVELLFAPRLVTKSGSQATIKGTTEISYATNSPVADTNSTQNTNESASVKSGPYGGIQVKEPLFTTWETGVFFECMPETSEDGNFINIQFDYLAILQPTWMKTLFKRVGEGATNGIWEGNTPIFTTQSMTTSLVLKNGDIVVIGGGTTDSPKNTIIYVLVSAQIVDRSGKAVDTSRKSNQLPSDPFRNADPEK